MRTRPCQQRCGAVVGLRSETRAAIIDLSFLEREMYAEAEAARLHPAPSTPAVTWAEFVEAGLLRQYRRALKVPLPELRVFIDLLRQRFDVPTRWPTSARTSVAKPS